MEMNLFLKLTILGLLPVFFTIGWIAARIDMKIVLKQVKSIPKKFYKALDALVDKKSDVTVNLLNDIIEQQNDTDKNLNSLDLTLTLGKLYRLRGENDKAILLHQKLLKYPDLSINKKLLLNYELGLDFKHAGLINRSEQQLEKLINTSFDKRAKEILLEIYQQDRDWKKAISLAKSLSYEKQTYNFEIAQFYCELAESSFFKSNFKESFKYVNKALNTNIKCPRANIILGDIYFKAEEYDKSIIAYEKIENQNYNYLSMISEKLFNSYEKINKQKEGLYRIIGYAQTFPNLDLIGLIYEKSRIILGEKKAYKIAIDLIKKNPNINNIYKLLNIKLMDKNPISLYAEIIQTTLGRYINKATMYRCNNCYFKSQIFFWHCPSCNKWETFTPNRIEI